MFKATLILVLAYVATVIAAAVPHENFTIDPCAHVVGHPSRC